MYKRILSLILVLCMCLPLIACGGQEQVSTEAPATTTEATETTEAVGRYRWAIYWYLCGSDLESNNGFATLDFLEMLEVELPEDVAVVIQTGGAKEWQNEIMDPTKLQRWLYDSDGLFLIDEQPSASMGDAKTLEDFLSFANTYVPAEKAAVIFWNHGGGSVSGAAFDECYNLDSLDLTEMYEAFKAVWPVNVDAPALELVGFDTCLMATVDVAAMFRCFAKYMVASQEVEPGNGWLYSGWLGDLAENPNMDGDDLGISICSSYYEGCEAVETESKATLSVTDLTKLQPLLDAYEDFGEEALVEAARDPGFFAQLGRAAEQSENYGGNTRDQGYTNMVDLGHLARQTAWMLPSAQAVCDALDDCIVYRVNGVYRPEATGLSCYYSYNGDLEDFYGYFYVGASTAFKYLYAYGLMGELPEGGEEYLATLDIQQLPQVQTLLDMDWEDAPLMVDEDGSAVLNLGPEAYDVLSSISFALFYLDEEAEMMLVLGTDNDLIADWDNGIFYDNFRGVWGAIDGHLVMMELFFEGDDYNLYNVPILLNDEFYNLQVVYDFNEEAWYILGATQSVDETGMASKDLRLLEEGDVITTVWLVSSMEDDSEMDFYPAEEFKVTENTSFGEMELFDGLYCMMFEMQDAAGNSAYSNLVMFECEDGKIYTMVYEE